MSDTDLSFSEEAGQQVKTLGFATKLSIFNKGHVDAQHNLFHIGDDKNVRALQRATARTLQIQAWTIGAVQLNLSFSNLSMRVDFITKTCFSGMRLSSTREVASLR